MMALILRPADDASAFNQVRQIRQVVFVEEQACPPDEEWDQHDAPDARGTSCFHLLGTVDGEPVATARWRPVGDAAKLERFAVLEAYRGGGLGRQLVAATLEAARAAGHSRFMLHAQAHLEGFYASFGFRRAGAPFDEAGIEHVKMVLNERAGTDPAAG
jgi:predicted GNAT family N-acyltransferase